MKRTATLATLVTLAAVLISLPACLTKTRLATPASPRPMRLVIRDIPLLKLPEGESAWSVKVGPGARHAAMAICPGDCDWIRGKGRWMALVDGRLSPTYDVPKPPPGLDFEPTVFFTKRIDVEIQLGSLRFSPDSQSTAYLGWRKDAATGEGIEFLVLKGVEVGRHAAPITGLVLSPDWRRWAYRVWDTPRQGFVPYIDGKEGRRAKEAGGFVFSPDSTRVAYVAGTGRKQYVVVDGVAGKPYDEVSFPAFSPDSRHVAYWGRISRKMMFVMDGFEGETCRMTDDRVDWDNQWEIEFSRDSKRVAYVGVRGDKRFVAVDGVRGGLYDDVSRPVFSPDSRWFYYMAVKGKKLISVIDGVEYGKLDFSSETGWLDVHEYELALSPDSKHVAVALKIVGHKHSLLLDGRKVEGYEDFEGPSFTPDSAHLVCWAQKGGKWWITVDGGARGEAYDELDPWFLWIEFDDVRSGIAVAARNRELVRVEIRIED